MCYYFFIYSFDEWLGRYYGGRYRYVCFYEVLYDVEYISFYLVVINVVCKLIVLLDKWF